MKTIWICGNRCYSCHICNYCALNYINMSDVTLSLSPLYCETNSEFTAINSHTSLNIFFQVLSNCAILSLCSKMGYKSFFNSPTIYKKLSRDGSSVIDRVVAY